MIYAFLLAAAASQQPIYGVAIAGDGDSLRIGETSIRLHGIDAPEFDQSCMRGGVDWACGAEAAEQLSKLVTGRSVRCVPVGTDQHDRTLARCSVMGRDVNLAMVESGFATAFRRYSTDYVAAEERARSAKRGIWAGTFKSPAEYREASQGPVQQRQRRPSVRTEQSQSAAGCMIKGNHSRRGEWIYHLPGMPYYERTRAEQMFCTEAEARAAGYRKAIAR
jgi:endonuclease YncB( thermonuclease family)